MFNSSSLELDGNSAGRRVLVAMLRDEDRATGLFYAPRLSFRAAGSAYGQKERCAAAGGMSTEVELVGC